MDVGIGMFFANSGMEVWCRSRSIEGGKKAGALRQSSPEVSLNF
jgi:hypothetical protein